MKIPIVDYESNDAPARFFKSIKDTGFGVLTNTFVKKDLINHVYEDWQRFFAQNLEAKMKFKFDPEVHDGYFPMKSETAKGAKVADLKEFAHYYPNRKTSTIPVTMATSELCLALEDLAMEILEWLEDHCPTIPPVGCGYRPSDWGEMVNQSQNTLYRVIHYPPLPEDAGEAVRAAAHEDINFLTLLPAATGSGLQVMDKAGNWHAVGTDANSIIVNVGDMLQLLTKGFYKSTTHRVVNPAGEAANKPRFSMPLFLHPHADTQLSPEKTAKQYLDERLRELGQK